MLTMLMTRLMRTRNSRSCNDACAHLPWSGVGVTSFSAAGLPFAGVIGVPFAFTVAAFAGIVPVAVLFFDCFACPKCLVSTSTAPHNAIGMQVVIHMQGKDLKVGF